jgi:hypothetical protein
MRRLLASVLAALAVSSASAAEAPRAPDPPATVEAVQMPAWLERDGARAPLAPGTALRAGDALRTGEGARVLLALPEGSSVRLGEQSEFRLETSGVRRDGVFVAAMNVLAGAFRFTTGALARVRSREVDVTIRTVTAGIRGTDLWGKAGDDRDVVCLIEGRIEVRRAGEPSITMAEPRSFFVAPRGGRALPVRPVEAAQLARWAAETEIEAGRGAARRGGRWAVVLAGGATERALLGAYGAAQAAGYAAEVRAAPTAAAEAYELAIGQLPSRADAEALAAALAGRFGPGAPRVAERP